MVATRRQKQRADSKDRLELEKSETIKVVEKARKEDETDADEENEQIGESPVETEANDPVAAEEGDNNEEHPGGEKQDEEVGERSALFVLDRTGDEEDEAAPPSKDGEKESKPGYGTTKKKRRKRGGRKNSEQQPNPLSTLLPGYTAPMQLDTSSLDKFRPAGGIRDLQRRAERTDVSTRGFVKEATKLHADVMKSKSTGLVTSSYTTAYSSFKKGAKRAPDTTAGDGWFGMRPTPMTEELKADLAVIRNRNYLDPKKFYKSADKFSNIVQLGTVIEGASEYFSGRLTKKERRSNITDEIMADPASADYAKRKFRAMAQEKTLEAKKRKRVHKPKRGKRLHS